LLLYWSIKINISEEVSMHVAIETEKFQN